MNNQDRVVIEFMIYFSVSSFFNLNGSILGFRALALFLSQCSIFCFLFYAQPWLASCRQKEKAGTIKILYFVISSIIMAI